MATIKSLPFWPGCGIAFIQGLYILACVQPVGVSRINTTVSYDASSGTCTGGTVVWPYAWNLTAQRSDVCLKQVCFILLNEIGDPVVNITLDVINKTVSAAQIFVGCDWAGQVMVDTVYGDEPQMQAVITFDKSIGIFPNSTQLEIAIAIWPIAKEG